MPSARPGRRAKTAVATYAPEKPTAAPQPKQLRQPANKVNVSDTSDPIDIVHASWRFIHVYLFLRHFQKQLNLPAVKLSKLESLFIGPPVTDASTDSPSTEPSATDPSAVDADLQKQWAKLLIPLLACVYADDRGHINESNYQQKLYKFYFNHSLDTLVQQVLERQTVRFHMEQLTVVERLFAMQDLIDHVFDTGHGAYWRNEVEADTMRHRPLGKDSDGWTYWLISDLRLYREIPGATKKENDDYTFELLASDVEQWEAYMTKWSKSKKPAEKFLSEQLGIVGAVAVERLIARKAAQEREAARLERARLYEITPKKRSRRIEVKSEADEQRRAVEDHAQNELEMEAARLAQERFDRDAELERDRKDMSIAESKLRELVRQFIGDKIHERIKNLDPSDVKELNRWQQISSRLKKSPTFEDIVDKFKDWVLLLHNDALLTVEFPLDTSSSQNPPDIFSTASDNGQQSEDQTSNLDAQGGHTVVHQPEDNITTPHQLPVGEPSLSIPLPTMPHIHTHTHNDQSDLPIQNGQPMSDELPQVQPRLESKPLTTPMHETSQPPTQSPASQLPGLPIESTVTSASPALPIDPNHTADAKPVSWSFQGLAPKSPAHDHDDKQSKAPIKVKARVGRARKFKLPKLYKRDLHLPFSHILHFTGPATESGLADPTVRFMLYAMVTNLRQLESVQKFEKRPDRRKRKKTLPPLPPFYTIQRDLLLDAYKDKGGFQQWLTDMDEAMNKIDPFWVEVKRHAYSLFGTVFAPKSS
ncbi:hypothetical protein DM01DRAFT_1330706 [Hesseltinella vesiculosa]|uniref:WHIM1 domain-containing protein n=1 Tax=Hesseltinella vesiculosa TaxID=101127 RepID=A0A1X2GWZ3_9FUNG|nr:hypothetical protein DM01DRAFT_1330706 [Hesseltinella vesiculosa]